MDIAAIMFYAAIGLIVAVAVYQMYLKKNNDSIDLANILPIVSEAVSSLSILTGLKGDYDKLLNMAISQVKILIDLSSISQTEKDYWTEERIKNIVDPILKLVIKNKGAL